ncbi:MAG: topoisomerase C-terminal repeat-containing protein, partial [Actinomycetota bacterium]
QWGDAKSHPEGHSKPVFAPLLGSMSPISVTLDDAVKMFGLPRVVGTHPGLGADIVATIGRHGAHLECGDKRATLDSDEAVFTVTLEEAIVAIDAAKPRRTAKPRGRRP